MAYQRPSGLQLDELRSISIQRQFTKHAPGSVLISAGNTAILCTASLDESVPPWREVKENETPRGWATAEYSMLPGSTSPRKRRERQKVDGRTNEIQRLIGRSLRAVIDFEALGPRTLTIDCDVLNADGGTRTLSITGGFIAMVDACANLETTKPIFKQSVAAVSVGLIQNEVLLDLCYIEDVQVDVDMNIVMTGDGSLVEVQGTAEGKPFRRGHLNRMLELAEAGIQTLTAFQRESLAEKWPLD